MVDGSILCAGADNSASHTRVKFDEEVNWPEPGAASFKWHGRGRDGREMTAEVSTELSRRTDRVDVMAEVPGFVKQIVAGAAGTRPYIYQVGTGEMAQALVLGWTDIVHSTFQRPSSTLWVAKNKAPSQEPSSWKPPLSLDQYH